MLKDKIEKLKSLIGKLPESLEINLPGITIKPKDVASKNLFLRKVFLPSENVFANNIARNFLYLFEGESSDYLKLLSSDFRKLFFKEYNKQIREKKGNAIAILGQQGVGKTFNTLLLSLQLIKENRIVYYCHDVKDVELTMQFVDKISTSFNNKSIFIIDNCHSDPSKTKDIVQWGCIPKVNDSNPHFIFVSRLMEKEILRETYGNEIPLIYFKREFIDFEFLINLYFRKINMPNEAEFFLKSIKETELELIWYNYRNMAFWNEIMLSYYESNDPKYTETNLLKKAHSFLSRKESFYFECPVDFSFLLAIAAYDLPIYNEYITGNVNLPIDIIKLLVEKNIFRKKEYDWIGKDFSQTVGLFYTPAIHPTKAEIILKLYQKFYGIEYSKSELFAEYAKANYQNMNSFLFSITDKNEMIDLYNNDVMIEATKKYITKRQLGKELDRGINKLSVLRHDQLCKIFDHEILKNLIYKINSPKTFITGKLYLLRALNRVIPEMSFILFCGYDEDVFVEDFLNIEDGTGITSFAKMMEIVKNIYYFAPNRVLKNQIIDSIKRCIDICAIEFIKRFENIHDFFTQFHWLLVRLKPMKLNNYFLGKIPIAKIIKFIREKDTNCVELCVSLLPTCKWTNVYNPDGSKVNYYQFIKNKLNYEDIKRIFENDRSSLFSIVRNASHEFVAKYLVQFSKEESFKNKIAKENKANVLLSIKYINNNIYLDDDDKFIIVDTIKSSRKDL